MMRERGPSGRTGSLGAIAWLPLALLVSGCSLATGVIGGADSGPRSHPDVATTPDAASRSDVASMDAPGDTAVLDAAGRSDVASMDAPGDTAVLDAAGRSDVVSNDAPRDAPVDARIVGACPTLANSPGPVQSFAWPAVSNTGNSVAVGATLRFHWSGTHNVVQQAGFGSPFTDPGWPNEIRSGARVADGSFDWNVGTFPCGYRPGLYYFVDEGNPAGDVVAVSLTEFEGRQRNYDARPCSDLANPSRYGARYAAYASRAGCTQYEVNNFQTETHYDYVPAAFGVLQGDVIVARWTGLHNVVQVHDQSQDQPYPGGIRSGTRTDCVGGPNYSCANGAPSLGEYLIDTTNYRPGIVHMSDQCAYGCEGCTVACNNVTNRMPYYGTPFQFMVSRRVRPTPPQEGSCCAIDRSKGQRCRLIDLYNDNPGTQFDTGLGGGITINRGDLVRFRWAGAVRIVQTTAVSTSTGVASQTPMPGGVAMPASIECVPGPNWTCLNGTTSTAQFVFDVERAYAAGKYQTFSYGGDFFDFYAFADNTNDPYRTTQNSAVLLPVGNAQPYTNNPPCP